MRIPMFVRPIPDGGYRASSFDVSAEGPTVEGAIHSLKAQFQSLIDSGAQVVDFEMRVDPPPHPWMPFAGIFRDDPLFEEWQQAIAENRRGQDDQPGLP